MKITYEFALFVFVLELMVLIGLLFLIFIKHATSNVFAHRLLRKKELIANFVLRRLNNKKASMPDFSQKNLLSVLESFNYKFNGMDWIQLKQELVERYLLPKARRYANSFFWERRNFAARIFALMPLPKDEEIICKLMDDPKFLVRSFAGMALTTLESSKGIRKILEHMSEEIGYAHYFFRDVLAESSQHNLSLVAACSIENKETKFHLSCLEVLSLKTSSANIAFLSQDLLSHNPKVRLAALKVLNRNPFKKLPSILLNSLEDPDEGVRLEAVLGLTHFKSEKALIYLKRHLSDVSWKVRSGSAIALRKLGVEGIAILNNQTPLKDHLAYEAAQYALQLS